MRLVILLLASSLTGCGMLDKEPRYDACIYLGGNDLHCFPVNQPGKKEYQRELNPGLDIVIDRMGFAEMKSHHRDLHERACR